MENYITIQPVAVMSENAHSVKRWKRGEFNKELGKYFWQYRCDAKKSERWVTKEQLDKYRYYEQQKNAAYYNENKNRHRELGKAWVNSNREKVNESSRKWRKRTPEKSRMYTANYRQRKLANMKETKFIIGFYDIAERTGRCLGIKMEVDHVKPISIGGEHSADNLQVLPRYWNIRKHNNPNYPIPSCYLTSNS